MSGSGEDRSWRGGSHRGGRQNQQRNFSRDQSSGTQPTPSSQSPTTEQSSQSGNAWPGLDRGNRNAPMPEEPHVPVRNFNSAETRDMLKQGAASISPPGVVVPASSPNTPSKPNSHNELTYRADSGDANDTGKQAGPWAAKRE
ncbi:MAG: hypothetical protein M1829_005290 [Trizodia sp. TS-e1964]|nr:MAG: hypothetical protein M1829_005290 [Trizodia sp. TS-e1964]